jgi:hypothetical protein
VATLEGVVDGEGAERDVLYNEKVTDDELLRPAKP